MTAIARELDAKIQSVDAVTAQRLEQLVRDALALADVPAPDAEAGRKQRVSRLFAAMDGVKEFAAAGSLSREELHAR